jgi:hypothetical protein
LPLSMTLVSAPGLLVFLVTRSSFFTWAEEHINPASKMQQVQTNAFVNCAAMENLRCYRDKQLMLDGK